MGLFPPLLPAKDVAGIFAVMGAVVTVPVMLSAGMYFDCARVSNAHLQVQNTVERRLWPLLSARICPMKSSLISPARLYLATGPETASMNLTASVSQETGAVLLQFP